MPFTSAKPREKLFDNEIVSVTPHAVVTTKTVEVSRCEVKGKTFLKGKRSCGRDVPVGETFLKKKDVPEGKRPS
jgi:hypothetical protein